MGVDKFGRTWVRRSGYFSLGIGAGVTLREKSDTGGVHVVGGEEREQIKWRGRSIAEALKEDVGWEEVDAGG